MTKPTGRPRGRPKTKEYMTLMARVDLALAHRVKRYASLHRQPISVVIRDALALLMDEYSSEPAPHRLAAHEFLSDRYDSPLDTLIGESDSAEREALLSDMKEMMVEAILSDINQDAAPAAEPSFVSDMNGEREYVSGTNRERAIMSDMNQEAATIAAPQKSCRAGHPPYPASKRECPVCVAARQARRRQKQKASAMRTDDHK
jgi:hypothetical protein